MNFWLKFFRITFANFWLQMIIYELLIKNAFLAIIYQKLIFVNFPRKFIPIKFWLQMIFWLIFNPNWSFVKFLIKIYFCECWLWKIFHKFLIVKYSLLNNQKYICFFFKFTIKLNIVYFWTKLDIVNFYLKLIFT